jgi:hypothetical protein
MKKITIVLFATLFLAFLGQGNAQCNYTLEMNDSWGDGWNGGLMDVLVNGTVVLDDVTLSGGSQGTLPIPVNTGDDVTTVFVAPGSYPGEISYRILDTGGVEVGTGDPNNDIPTGTITASCPSCLSPTNLSASSITDTQADLSWTPRGTETLWNIEYGATGFTQGTGTTVNGVSNPYTLTGLTQNTSYDYYVQADCGGSTSSWVGPYTFTTLPTAGTCGLYRVDLIDSFGDGWNGGTLDVYINGTLYGSYTIATGSGPESHLIPADINDILTFDYTAGSYPGENEYQVFDETDTLIATEGAGGATPNDIGDPTIPSGLTACAACPSPTALTATNITDTQADLSWTAGGTETLWNIEYGATGFTQGTGTTVNGVSNPHTLTGLTQNTTYDYYVQADCGGSTSTWAGPYTFVTACSTILAPFNEDFETTSTTLSCWKNEITTDQLQWQQHTGATPSSGTGPSSANGGTHYIYVETSGSSNGDTAIFYSPSLDLSALTTPRLNFYYHMYGAGMDPDGNIDVAISTDGGATYTSIFNQVGDQGNQWNQALVDLSAYTGVVVFRIAGTVSSTGTTYENDFAIDDFVVEETPACPAPTALTATNITDTQADLSWTAGGTETVWNIEYGATGFTQGTGTTVNGVSNPYTLTGLTQNTSYDYYVQADCGGSTSSWVGPYTLTTACTTLNSFPFTEDFEATSTTRDCWTQIHEVGSADWTYQTGSSGGSITTAHGGTLNARFVSQSGTNSPVTKLVSPMFDLTSLTSPQLSFWYGQEDWAGDQNELKVYYSNDGGTTWVEIAYYTANVPAWTQETLTLPNPTATYMIAFEGINNYGRANVIDDVMIEEGPTDTADWYNLQWPPNINIAHGDATGTPNGSIVYAQVYEAGLTDTTSGQAPGINVWIGYGPTGTNPNTWSNWIPATFNQEIGNNDEYKMDFASNMPLPGTYDYASRIQLNGGPYTYGGYSSGPWDGTTNVSGVLIVTPPVNDDCNNATVLTVGNVYADNAVSGTLSGATPDVNITPSCGAIGWVTYEAVWYMAEVPPSGNLIIETKTNGGILDSTVTAYSGADCNNLVEIGCDDDGGDGSMSLITLEGLVPGEIILIRVWEYGNNNFDTFEISAYDNSCTGGSTTWNGTSWSNGTPNNTMNAIIDGSYVTNTNGNIDACSLKITGSGDLTVSDIVGNYVKVEYAIVNDGLFIVEQKGAVVQVDDKATVTGDPNGFDVEVKTQNLTGPRYTYFSSPTRNSSTTIFDTWAQPDLKWKFDGNTQAWVDADNESMETGEGYIVTQATGTTGVFATNFIGAFNNGIVTQEMYVDKLPGYDQTVYTDDDSSLVGNPYPSAIDSDLLYQANPRLANIYIWSPASPTSGGNFPLSDYITCAANRVCVAYAGGSGTHDGYIATGQGFFAVSDENDPALDLIFNNSMRVTDHNDQFRRNAANEVIWINMTGNNNTFSQMAIPFTSNGSVNFDPQYDTERLGPESGTPIAIYSFANDTNQILSIDDRGVFNSDITVPVGMYITDANVNELTVTIDRFNNFDDINVYLKDNLFNTIHDLKVSDYTFVPQGVGEYNNRFEILFSRTALATDNEIVDSNDLIVSNHNDSQIKVKMLSKEIITEFKAFDVVGKLVIDMKPNSNNFLIDTDLKQGQVLFIKAVLKNGQTLKTKFIKL